MKISSSLETRELTELPKKWLQAYKDGLIVVYKGDSKFSEETVTELIKIFQYEKFIYRDGAAKWREIGR